MYVFDFQTLRTVGCLLILTCILKIIETGLWAFTIGSKEELGDSRFYIPFVGGIVFFTLCSTVFYHMIQSFKLWAGPSKKKKQILVRVNIFVSSFAIFTMVFYAMTDDDLRDLFLWIGLFFSFHQN